jgi:tetratricopeptide (TPR) repeat protein
MSAGRLSRVVLLILGSLLLAGRGVAQENQDNQPHIQPRVDPNTPTKADKRKKAEKPAQPPDAKKQEPESTEKEQPPSAEEQPGESSSKDSLIDLNAQPLRSAGGSRVEADPNGHPWNPHQADKDIEVGNYYLKHKNYRAALERFRSALMFKPNDAEATFGLAVTQEHMELFTQAYRTYSKYLEILPHGPQAQLARDAMKRIGPRIDKDPEDVPDAARQAARSLEQGENFLAKNDYEAARLRFEDAARLTPEDPLVYFRLAQSLQGLQRLDPARTYYKRYLELQPSGPFAADAKRSIQQISEVLGK